MTCLRYQELKLEVDAASNEVRLRMIARQESAERQECDMAGEEMAFLEQAVVESELRLTEKRLSLDEHKGMCGFCSDALAN